MRIGGSLFLIAVGAILKWAVTDHVNNVNLGTIGVILMVVGIVGLVLSLAFAATRRRTDVIHQTTGRPYIDPQTAGRGYVDPAVPADSHTVYIEPNPQSRG